MSVPRQPELTQDDLDASEVQAGYSSSKDSIQSSTEASSWLYSRDGARLRYPAIQSLMLMVSAVLCSLWIAHVAPTLLHGTCRISESSSSEGKYLPPTLKVMPTRLLMGLERVR